MTKPLTAKQTLELFAAQNKPVTNRGLLEILGEGHNTMQIASRVTYLRKRKLLKLVGKDATRHLNEITQAGKEALINNDFNKAKQPYDYVPKALQHWQQETGLSIPPGEAPPHLAERHLELQSIYRQGLEP